MHRKIASILAGCKPAFWMHRMQKNVHSSFLLMQHHFAILSSFKPSQRSWKGSLPTVSPPLSDTLATSIATSVAPSPRFPPSTHALLSQTPSAHYNTQPSRSRRYSLILKMALIMLMPTSFVTPCLLKGSITTSSPGSGPS